MKVFFNNDSDWVVAENEAEAIRLWERDTGESSRDYYFNWKECDPDEVISVWVDPEDCEMFPIPIEHLVEVGKHENMYRATVGQWLDAMAAAQFKGFWISTEF